MEKDNYEAALATDGKQVTQKSILNAKIKLGSSYYRLGNMVMDQQLSNEYFRRSLNTWNDITKADPKNALIEEYSKYDKDLRLLTYRILLEKFNNQYKDLLPEQKNILKEFITSTNSTTRLRIVINEQVAELRETIKKLRNKVTNEIVKIKLEEIYKVMSPIKNTQKVDDNHLVSLMQYYELVNELKNL